MKRNRNYRMHSRKRGVMSNEGQEIALLWVCTLVPRTLTCPRKMLQQTDLIRGPVQEMAVKVKDGGN